MAFRATCSSIRPATASIGSYASRRLATVRNAPSERLYEYVVIIHDLPSSKRRGRTTSNLPSLQRLSFVGNIVGSKPKDIRGDVLACQAPSKEQIEQELSVHPFAKDVWDMKNVSIWPFETIHSTPLDILSATKEEVFGVKPS